MTMPASSNMFCCIAQPSTVTQTKVYPEGTSASADIEAAFSNQQLNSSTSSWPGGLPDDMQSATTGLLTLDSDNLPSTSASAHVRPVIMPEVRKPSLHAGFGSPSVSQPHSKPDSRLARRPSFVQDLADQDAYEGLSNMESRHATQTYKWQQQHFGERSGHHHHQNS